MKHHYLCSNRGVFPSTETFHSFHWRSQNGISIGDRFKLGLWCLYSTGLPSITSISWFVLAMSVRFGSDACADGWS
ncbi:hypothetical protein COLINT_02497 [Collinsella intestinalis DSM 13280]|uniref:Uncharacterized protein n=1 Tax=Collinsella intestinalis DSM 13280 TaxID=521003 RepID=C4F8X1_9ACTN|nr:hypothetical protein COLINT_02497 [Collinsella intestinalis DSM 13280]